MVLHVLLLRLPFLPYQLKLGVCLMQVASGLSQLGPSATGTHQVYQTLTIKHTDLQNPQAVAHCRHIQQLQLSGNCLTTLQPLSHLQHLTRLDVSHNRLSQVGVQCSDVLAAAHPAKSYLMFLLLLPEAS